ncbi:MAG: acyloxyacyl hydrolase, partial [Proteobacteria bacterium]|nr:acyloxyacyl hydrolase [Pseudomonadota bacterium]
VLVLTTFDTDEYIFHALEAGAKGFLLKDASRDELFKAVRAVSKGESGPITYDVADRIGALHVCDVCARPIVEIDVLVTRVVAHYARGNGLARRLREALFRSPDALGSIGSPRPHLGFSVNTGGDTDQFYAGLTWEWDFWRRLFAGFGLGGAIHDGETETSRTDRKELGCRVLFRGSLELGYRLTRRHGISLFYDQISNLAICDKNEGLETAGVRYGYRF